MEMGMTVVTQTYRCGSKGSTAIRLPVAVPGTIVALGAESKGAIGVARGRCVRLSESFGALTDPANYRAFRAAVSEAVAIASPPVTIVHDLHPQYLSSELARSFPLGVRAVQHHHGHVAACMAEHELTQPVIGICCDGAGYGPDGASWGCEILYAMPQAFTRVAHLGYFPLPGGDAAAVECWRPAWGLVRQAYGRHVPDSVRAAFSHVPEGDLAFADAMLAGGVQCPRCGSLGRFFDAIAFLLGICRQNTREAEGACALQQQAEALLSGRLLPTEVHTDGDAKVLDFAPAVRELLRRSDAGDDVAQLAADLHETVAAVLAGRAIEAAGRFGTDTVVLTGGCMANRWLVRRLRHRFAAVKLRVFEHVKTSCGDAGLPLGQSYVAAAIIAAS
jgi:hydrogenase maturation protein HypF